MSTFEIKMPKLGESITEGTILTWAVNEGDFVMEDQILFEVSTAKVNAEVPSPVAGKVSKINFKEGETVHIGVVVAIIELESVSEVSTTEKEKPTIEEQRSQPSPISQSKTPIKENSEDRWYSPIVLQIAEESKISKEELDMIPGTGYLGRLSKSDIIDYIEKSRKSNQETVAKPAQKSQQIDIGSEIKDKASRTESIEMDPIQRLIADRMVQSKKISAHVTTVVEADVTKLVNWRNRQKDKFLKEEGISLTYLPVIVEATTKALKEYPIINASVDGHSIILKKEINIGIAVSLPDGNLIVPVIHDADKMNISGLAHRIDSLASKARSNELKIDDIQGGTFTITNFGSFKNIIGTPIINQPEVAILGVGYIDKKPSVIETPDGDVIAIRSKVYLSLSYDHRVINGAVGGAFLKRIADLLENWNVQ